MLEAPRLHTCTAGVSLGVALRGACKEGRLASRSPGVHLLMRQICHLALPLATWARPSGVGTRSSSCGACLRTLGLVRRRGQLEGTYIKPPCQDPLLSTTCPGEKEGSWAGLEPFKKSHQGLHYRASLCTLTSGDTRRQSVTHRDKPEEKVV